MLRLTTLVTLLCSYTSALASEWDFRGSLEATFWAADEPTPTLLDFEGQEFFAPRLSLSLDYRASDYWQFHATTRLDRGFDAGDRPDGQIRLDEIYLRYRPFGDQRLNIQIGKFATAFGGWVRNHEFYDNPFLNAPLAYGEIIGSGVRNAAANSRAAISNRNANTVFGTPQSNWSALIWGPAYTSGISVFGTIGQFDYAAEIKNVAPGANPDQWNPSTNDFESPTFSGHLAYRPNAAWNIGVSYSRGPYLNPEAEVTLPEGLDRGDLPHQLIGFDLSYAYRNWIISGEIIHSRYETISGDHLESLSWYLQSRWKFAPGMWLANRFGQTTNNDVLSTSGERIPWSPDLWRAEMALGWRINPDLLLKTQYSFTHTSGPFNGPGEQLFGLGIGWRFW